MMGRMAVICGVSLETLFTTSPVRLPTLLLWLNPL